MRSYTSALQGWLRALLGLQIFTLLLYGANRVSAVVRADITSKIMESHRLMPTSAFSAVMGYVVGAPVQAIALAVVNYLVGIFAADGAGVPQECWLIANAMIGAFALMAWAVTAQIAFAARGAFLLMVIATLMGVFSNGAALVLLPGLSVITSPLIGRSVFRLSATMDDLSFAFAVALIAQFVIGAICFRAAMRKYRWPEAVGFSPLVGLLLVAAWVVTSLLGLNRIDEFVPIFFRSDRAPLVAQFVATLVTGMLLAIVPVSSAARELGDWRRNGGATPAQPKQPAPLLLTVTLATLMLAAVLLTPPVRWTRSDLLAPLTLSAVVLLAAMLALGMLFRWVYLIMPRAWLVAVIWLALVWLGPLLADLVYHMMLPDPPDALTMISGMSPIGALVLLWSRSGMAASAMPGIVFQVAMVMLPTMLFWHARRRTMNLS
jgi:hypothetical protein